MAYLLGASIAIVLFSVIIGVAVYILMGLSHMKALQALGYDKAWLVWIPVIGIYYACADVAMQNRQSITLFGRVEIPAVIFKFWWVILLLEFVNPLAKLAKLVALVGRVILLGTAYSNLYSRLEGKMEQDTQAIGLLSGFLPIIAMVKFFMV